MSKIIEQRKTLSYLMIDFACYYLLEFFAAAYPQTIDHYLFGSQSNGAESYYMADIAWVNVHMHQSVACLRWIWDDPLHKESKYLKAHSHDWVYLYLY